MKDWVGGKTIDKRIGRSFRVNKVIMITNSGSCSELNVVYFVTASLLFAFIWGKKILYWVDDTGCSCDNAGLYCMEAREEYYTGY